MATELLYLPSDIPVIQVEILAMPPPRAQTQLSGQQT